MSDRDRILVTGANGHLGRRLIAHLAAESGRDSLCAVVRSQRAAAQIEALPEAIRPEVAIVDYADAGALAQAARGCRAVVHLVGIIKEIAGTSYQQAHEATCRALVRAAADAGVERIVYLSIFGSRPEADNACLASKGRAEAILLEGDVPATVLRVPMVLGRGDIASRSLASQARAPFLLLIGGGRTLQQPIDADDVIRAIASAVARHEPIRGALDLGGPETLSQRELIARVAQRFGSRPAVIPVPVFAARAVAALIERTSASPPLTRAMLGVLQHDDRIDATEACKQLGIELTPLDEMLARCMELGAEADEA